MSRATRPDRLTEGSLAGHARLLGGWPARHTLEAVPGITSSRRSDPRASPERNDSCRRLFPGASREQPGDPRVPPRAHYVSSAPPGTPLPPLCDATIAVDT
jgi:hypothetical protein